MTNHPGNLSAINHGFALSVLTIRHLFVSRMEGSMDQGKWNLGQKNTLVSQNIDFSKHKTYGPDYCLNYCLNYLLSMNIISISFLNAICLVSEKTRVIWFTVKKRNVIKRSPCTRQ
jgi:hypothetical protein